MSTGLIKMLSKSYAFTNYVYVFEEDLVLNNIGELICHITLPKQSRLMLVIIIVESFCNNITDNVQGPRKILKHFDEMTS